MAFSVQTILRPTYLVSLEQEAIDTNDSGKKRQRVK